MRTFGRPALIKLKVTRSANGVSVVSVETNSPLCHVALVFNAGSRFETYENEGLVHTLRNVAGIASNNCSALGLTRNIQQMGGNLQVTSARETLSYSLDCYKSFLDAGIQFLEQAARRRVYKPWEVRDRDHFVRLELADLQDQPHVTQLDALHRAAYRSGLGSPLYMQPHRLGSHTPDDLLRFSETYCTLGNMALVGVGPSHDELLRYVAKFGANDFVDFNTPKATYYGGEQRIDTAGDVAHVAVVTEGAALGSKEMMALAVLRHAMGVGSTVKYGSTGAGARLSKAAAATNNPCALSALSVNYSDSGLFGFQVSGLAPDMGPLLKGAAAAFQNVTKTGLTEAEVSRAKKQLQAAMWMGMEEASGLAEDYAVQALFSEHVQTPDDLVASVDKVTAADVNTVAKKVINGKPSMAAVGNLGNTPYLDQLL